MVKPELTQTKYATQLNLNWPHMNLSCIEECFKMTNQVNQKFPNLRVNVELNLILFLFLLKGTDQKSFFYFFGELYNCIYTVAQNVLCTTHVDDLAIFSEKLENCIKLYIFIYILSNVYFYKIHEYVKWQWKKLNIYMLHLS